MELSRFERVLLKIEQRSERISGKISKDLGKVKPFDAPVIPMKEKLERYMGLTDEQKQEYRQQFGEEFNLYEKQMNDLITRRNANA